MWKKGPRTLEVHMSTEIRPIHSTLGASGAERWMNCAGSVNLLKSLHIPEESDEPEYRSLGTSAHEAAHACLTQQVDAWEVIGRTFGKHIVDGHMSNAIQVYLDEVRSLITPTAQTYFEFGIDAPEFHPSFYGTLDCGIVDGDTMHIRDYKHGEGIAVDVEENPQIMYYAYGLLRHHPEVERVTLGIVQPRIVYLNPVRVWETTADHIRDWAVGTLRPAMERTALDHDLDAGSWCRFCPAKLVSPLMWSLFGAAMQTDPKQVINLSPNIFGKSYSYLEPLKFFVKAFEAEAFRRLSQGDVIPEIKLVEKKANRIFKTGAEPVFVEKFGQEAYTPRELKSPAQMSGLG